MTTALLALLACSGLNRARGDDRWMPDWMPGRALFYAAPAIGAVAFLVTGSLVAAAIWGLGFIVWGLFPWGHLIGLGRHMPDRPPSRLEATLLELSGGSVHLALWLRMLLCLPAFVGAGWWVGEPLAMLLALPFAGAAVAAYEAAWRVHSANPIWIAELVVGAAWGLVIVILGGPP